MARWFGLCHGLPGFPGCRTCLRWEHRNTRDAQEAKQAWIQPVLTDSHCNSYIETPAYVLEKEVTSADER